MANWEKGSKWRPGGSQYNKLKGKKGYEWLTDGSRSGFPAKAGQSMSSSHVGATTRRAAMGSSGTLAKKHRPTKKRSGSFLTTGQARSRSRSR